MNKNVLMSGADYFGDDDAINDLMDSNVPVDVDKAKQEHLSIARALKSAGVQVNFTSAPPDCQDGVYTANWALVRGGKALMSRLPNTRQPEEKYAIEAVRKLGLEPVVLPENVERFSGQGDALPCGDIVFTQSPFRTTTDAHPYLKSVMGFREVVALQTKPARKFPFGPAVVNKITGWPDSPTYDIDLAIAIIKPPSESNKGLIAYCPDVFKNSSRKLLQNYDGVDKIVVSKQEAMNAYALNMVSTGDKAVINRGAPQFKANLEKHGLTVTELDLPELAKGGGSIRCTTLTLDN